MKLAVLLATACSLALAQQDPEGPLVEPYPLLHGDNPTGGKAVPTSPDPLVRTTWDSSAVNITALQRYETAVPCAWVADPPSASSGAGAPMSMAGMPSCDRSTVGASFSSRRSRPR